MFLIVYDSSCIKQDREYYLCKADFLQNILDSFPEIKDIKKDDIEEILLCSIKKEDRDLSSKICKCKQF